MANMSYCRFQNTLSDLRDCYDNMEEASSPDEKDARRRLIALCERITNDYTEDYDFDEADEFKDDDDDNELDDDEALTPITDRNPKHHPPMRGLTTAEMIEKLKTERNVSVKHLNAVDIADYYNQYFPMAKAEPTLEEKTNALRRTSFYVESMSPDSIEHHYNLQFNPD